MLIDAHAHLDQYGDALDAALGQIREHRILTIGVSMDLPSYERTLQIAARCPLVLPTFGIHPWRAAEYAGRLDELHATVERSPMLGEIGLDRRFVEDAAHYPAQRTVFEFFLAAARDQHKIVNLHTSGAEAEILSLLSRYGIHRAVVHWYAGPLDTLRALAALGVYFTVGVEVLHSDRIRSIARAVPPGQLLTETDNPVGAEWLTGTPGMPRLIEDVLQALAELQGTHAEAMAQAVRANFARLIGDDPRLAGIRRRLLEEPGASGKPL